MSIVRINTKLKRDKFRFSANLEINHRVTGMFGPSGSGKTTFLHLLAGLQRPDTGFIKINGKTLVDTRSNVFTPAHKRGVGYVFQEGRVFPHINVERNLKYGWKKNTHNIEYYHEIVELLELSPLLNRRSSGLSGGQIQRVAIGRALMSNAEILLLDEPFTALDEVLKKQVISLLNKLINHLDIPMIIVSHDLKDLLMLSQNLVLIDRGQTEPPQSYLELVQKNKFPKVDHLVHNYYNIYNGRVIENNKEKGLAIIELKENPEIKIQIEHDDMELPENSGIKLSIRGVDVALSASEVNDISIRNQLEGKVKQLFQHKNHTVCIVNCGITIITRITTDSARKLSLAKGKKIWCLFKSLAIESI
ncbi:MAG: molybdenum ABC transporter ATP-binding protein [Bacteroidales bacterium]|jgi:molybdate transport system ATP-binding protein